MILKTLFYLGVHVFLYTLILLEMQTSLFGQAILCLLLGVSSALIGFNIGHDAIHGSYSSKAWLNSFLSHSFSLIGAYPLNWAFTHNIAHHTFTNVLGADGDYDPTPLIRFSNDKKWIGTHKFQQYYSWILYSVFTLEWAFYRDFNQILKKNHLIYKKKKAAHLDILKLVVAKTVYFSLFLGVPTVVMSVPFWQVAVGFILMHVGLGLTLTLVFQLGHLVEGTSESNASVEGKMNDSFYVHQIKSSSNFCSQGRLAAWLTGGLNTQIEHHLFPKICHVHYRNLAPIIKKTMLEFDLPYNEFNTYTQALHSHFKFLKKMGLRPA